MGGVVAVIILSVTAIVILLLRNRHGHYSTEQREYVQ